MLKTWDLARALQPGRSEETVHNLVQRLCTQQWLRNRGLPPGQEGKAGSDQLAFRNAACSLGVGQILGFRVGIQGTHCPPTQGREGVA